MSRLDRQLPESSSACWQSDELLDARVRLESALDAGAIATWVWDIVNDRVWADRNLAAFFSVSPEIAAGGPVARYLQAIHPDDREATATAIQQALAGQATFDRDYRVILADGSIRWLEVRAKIVRDESGRAIQMPGVAIDVTDRKASEAALRRSEAFARGVLESSPDCVKIIDQDGRLLWMNGSGKRAMDVCDFEAIRHAYWPSMWATGGLSERAAQAMEEAKRGGVGRFEGFCPTMAGTSKWWDVIVVEIPSADGASPELLSVSRDVTQQRRDREAIRDNEERFRHALTAANMGSWRANLATGQGTRDANLNRILGHPAVESTQPIDDCFRLVHPDDVGPAIQSWRRAIETRGVYETEFRLLREDGSRRWLREQGRFVPGGPEAPDVVTGVTLDVTERREAQEALRQADRFKDEFLATLAHELRNPLAPIQNALHLLGMSEGDAALAGELREMIERQVRQLSRLVDDLLDVSRISTGRIELRREPTDLTDVLTSAVETSRPLIAAGNHRLTVQTTAEPVLLHADPVRLAQVFSNLLNNAAKYSEPGGSVTLTARREAEEVVVSVRDTGVGIPAEMLPRIFDLFTQVDRTLEKSQGGLGIGLALVRRLLGLHGGSITAHSEGMNRGSEFIVRLPTLETSPLADAAQQAGAVGRAGECVGHRVLVVDDNRDSCASLAKLLTLLGNEVWQAHDGFEALTTVATHCPEVVVMDIGMPGLNGYEVARRLRSDPVTKNTTLIALTGWGQDDDRRRSREAGFDHHLVKPVDLAAVKAILAGVAR